jgi:hypothetical protein
VGGSTLNACEWNVVNPSDVNSAALTTGEASARRAPFAPKLAGCHCSKKPLRNGRALPDRTRWISGTRATNRHPKEQVTCARTINGTHHTAAQHRRPVSQQGVGRLHIFDTEHQTLTLHESHDRSLFLAGDSATCIHARLSAHAEKRLYTP